jgi:hypothetical protein
MTYSEKPTLIERFIQLIPVRYPLAVVAWVVLLEPVGFGLTNYLQTGESPLYFPHPVNALIGLLLFPYTLYTVRYLRVKVAKAEPLITPIMEGKVEAYNSVFGRVTNTRAILILTIVFEGLTTLATGGSNLNSTPLGIFNLATQFLLLLSISTLIWEYSAASWGLHRLGRSPLKLKSFLEDRFLGARPIGNVALSLTVAYLGGLLLFFLDTATFLPVGDPFFESFFLILLGLGVVLFFLPLNSIHGRMQAEKADHLGTLGRKLVALRQANRDTASEGPASLERVESAITELVRMKDLEITERKLVSTATWPFDAQLLAKLITIIVSITAVLLARIITDLLKL